MRIQLNGEPRDVLSGQSLGSLVDSIGLERAWVVAERNSEVPPRADWDSTILEDGDQIELVRFMGGGA